jgi:hypothetical protein
MHRTLYGKSLFPGFYQHLKVVRRQDVVAAEAPQAASVDGAFIKRSAAGKKGDSHHCPHWEWANNILGLEMRTLVNVPL